MFRQDILPQCIRQVHQQQESLDDRHRFLIQDWPNKFSRRMRVVESRAILLFDNATSHSAEGLRLTHVVVKFLRPNTKAHIQPMDAGIIRNFKGFYRGLLVRYFCSELWMDKSRSFPSRQPSHTSKKHGRQLYSQPLSTTGAKSRFCHLRNSQRPTLRPTTIFHWQSYRPYCTNCLLLTTPTSTGRLTQVKC